MSDDKRGPDVATNRAARYSYEIVETFEVGIVLAGTEVKSLRDGKARLQDSYAAIEDGEVYLRGAYIPPYPPARDNHEPERARKLLMHRWEIERLIGRMQRKGLTLIPTGSTSRASARRSSWRWLAASSSRTSDGRSATVTSPATSSAR